MKSKKFLNFSLFLIILSSILFISIYPTFNKVNAEVKLSDKNIPVVFLHGFMGYGRDEESLLKKQYWGNHVCDLQEYLNSQGYTTMTAQVAPFSSNWHRACEFYAYVKGGRVDYGEYTANKFGHERYGRTYQGIYPKWDNNHPINIIAHSQGGQTARVLAHLLNYGFEKEINYNQDNLSDLFSKNPDNKGMVKSITTIATPHDGTTATLIPDRLTHSNTFKLIPFLEFINGGNAKLQVFDYQLEYWGLHQKQNENLFDFYLRNKNNPAWDKEKAFAMYDLSPKGAKELNSWVKDVDDIYYFSYACQKTRARKTLSGRNVYYVQKDVKNISTTATAFLIAKTASNYPLYEIDSKYNHNDGVVNTYSAIAPHIGRNIDNVRHISLYSNDIKPGIWSSLGIIPDTDHNQICGMFPNKYLNIKDFYIKHLEFLKRI